MKRALYGLCLSVCVLAAPVSAETTATTSAVTKPQPGQGWHELGRIHVRDNAEKDLAFLHDGDDVVEIRVCAERNSIRLRNAESWMSGDKRQKLWLPLVLGAGKCLDPSKVQGGPIRVTHLALEYEAMSLGTEGAHLSIYGKTRKAR
ncbi:MAG: hypothetical protein JNK92_00190 [Dechloromonas sp.]|nr:hypothetical protein [Dechloromonas sp.]